MPCDVLVVATQLGAAMNEMIAERVPSVLLVPVPPGPPRTLPEGATVFFAAPARTSPLPSGPAPQGRLRIRWIQLLSAGADGYPAWYFQVPTVTCSRGPTAQPIAEFTFAAILARAKCLPEVWIGGPSEWQPRTLGSLDGSTLGIVGYGSIGRAIATMARALGMRVLVTRRDLAARADDCEVVPLAELMAQAEHLVIAAAATAATRHLIGRAELAAARPGSHLVNVARGSLVDQEALLEALDAGRLGWATLDVTDPEPLPVGHPLYAHPKVWISPHLSAHGPRLFERLASGFADNLERYLRGEPLRNRVDPLLGY